MNHDPRAAFVGKLFDDRGEYDVFPAFCRTLLRTQQEGGIVRSVHVWLRARYRACDCANQALDSAAFTVVLSGRTIGCAAEIDDHLHRDRNLDTRAPQPNVRFFA
ncbi:hypothetical protein P3W85_03120 [Cupriavidus basilensis]|uniref:Uncharacterized protein n=1 Tax=Cupriavidus basilensis TaxID=68895 RepID=A0ABT6AH75_9BURK|nr:hypothetical protein [Cupriavidus basilensis]MDF3831950.1 hypothetical protein [Cupriavidus basilensis]